MNEWIWSMCYLLKHVLQTNVFFCVCVCVFSRFFCCVYPLEVPVLEGKSQLVFLKVLSICTCILYVYMPCTYSQSTNVAFLETCQLSFLFFSACRLHLLFYCIPHVFLVHKQGSCNICLPFLLKRHMYSNRYNKGIIIPSSISHYYSLFIIINPWTFLLKQFSLPFFEGIPASWMDMIHFPKAISHYFPSNDLLILKGIVHGVYHAIFKELHTFSTEYCIHRTVSVLIKMLLPQKELALFPNRSAPFHKGNAADILSYMLFMEDNTYCFQKKLRHI